MRKMKYLKIILFCFFLFLIGNSETYSQNSINDSLLEKKYEARYWLNIGYGNGFRKRSVEHYHLSIPEDPMLNYALSLSLTYQKAWKSLTLSYMYLDGPIYGFEEHNIKEEFIYLGILFGLNNKSKNSYCSISSGVAYTKGKHVKSSEEPLTDGPYTIAGFYIENKPISINTLGIPLECQLYITPSSYFGLGINVFANINTVKSFYGVLFCVSIGKLR